MTPVYFLWKKQHFCKHSNFPVNPLNSLASEMQVNKAFPNPTSVQVLSL